MHSPDHLRALAARYIEAAATADTAKERQHFVCLAARCQEMLLLADLPRAYSRTEMQTLIQEQHGTTLAAK